jgi:hypothetical protein
MSENSGPAGQGKTPSKPRTTPTPAPSWNINSAIRGGVKVNPAVTPPSTIWNAGSSADSIIENRRTGSRGAAYDQGRFIFSLTSGGITASDSLQPQNPLPNIALLGDYGNRASLWANDQDNLYSAETAASAWLAKNINSDNRLLAFDTLVAKGYIGPDEAKLDRNSAEANMILAQALTNAVTSISVTNYSRLNSGMDMLTLDEGLDGLMPAPSTTTSGGGSSYGGRSVQITRQEFKPEDYRIAVDKAYTDITGQAADEDTLSTYIKVLQRLEKADPLTQVSKTTGSASSSKTVTKQTGGVSQDEAQDVLLKQALKEPETEYYQKATTFMDYFTEAMKSKVNL